MKEQEGLWVMDRLCGLHQDLGFLACLFSSASALGGPFIAVARFIS
jgi:hypothetical protein